MPNNTSWVPSAVLWGIAALWLIATLVYWFRHRHDIKSISTQDSTSSIIEDIKSDLITMNTLEREIATKKAEQPCPKKIAQHICADYEALLGRLLPQIMKMAINHDEDAMVDYFKLVGDILDNNHYGLKVELGDNDLYKNARLDLAQKREGLKMKKRKKHIVQANIDKARMSSYGLNSAILFRGVFNSVPEKARKVPTEIRMTLEDAESASERILNMALSELESDC